MTTISTPLQQIDSIVVALGADPGADAVFEHALALAVLTRARLGILHVAEGGLSGDSFPRVRETLARWQLLPPSASRADVAARLGVSVRKVGISGRGAAGPIVDYLNAHPVSLLVVGTSGRQGLARILSPSVGQRIGRGARLPTLYLPARAAGFVSAARGEFLLPHVLVPVDHAPDPGRAVAFAAALVAVLGDRQSEAELLHAGVAAAAPWRRVAGLTPPGWRQRAVAGTAVSAIAAAARPESVIVMATAGRHGAFESLLGSTAEHVIAAGPCAVITVPA